jgi:hypothetical protein
MANKCYWLIITIKSAIKAIEFLSLNPTMACDLLDKIQHHNQTLHQLTCVSLSILLLTQCLCQIFCILCSCRWIFTFDQLVVDLLLSCDINDYLCRLTRNKEQQILLSKTLFFLLVPNSL